MLEFTVLYDFTTVNVSIYKTTLYQEETYTIFNVRQILRDRIKEGQLKILRITVLASITLIKNPYNSFS